MAQTRRRLLGTRRSVSSQERVYRAADYLEIDDIEGYEVTRKRIFYDEILLVTFHATHNVLLLAAVAIPAGLFAVVALSVSMTDRVAGLIIFLIGSLPFGSVFVLRLLAPVRVVTVFGKRTKAAMHFWLRDTRATEVYRSVCRLAQERQARPSRQLRDRPAAPASIK